MSYTCHTCGMRHDELPDIGADLPDPVLAIPEAERATRVKRTEETCIVDDEHYFIRGVILIPLRGREDHFGFGVWVTQKKEHFETYVAEPDTDTIGPFFGWLSNSLHFYTPDTFCLKTRAHFRGNGLRPSIELEPTDHPLAVDQREGITLEKAWEIVHHAGVAR